MSYRQKVTIQDIANKVGVSGTTVSRYLNGKYDRMSEKTRNEIAKTIEEVGYRPNKVARNLKTKKSELIGIVLADAKDNMIPFLLSGIFDICAKHGWNTIVVNSKNDEKYELEQVQTLIDNNVDGLLILSGYNYEYYKKLDEAGLPVVLMERIPTNSTLDNVYIDHYSAVSDMVNYLIDGGYEHFVVFTPGSVSTSTLVVKEQAVTETCRQRFGNDEHYEVVVLPHRKSSLIEHEIKKYERSCDTKRTVLFVVEPELMVKTIVNFYSIGLTPSKYLTIAGYDVRDLGVVNNRISTIFQPLLKMSEIATERLIDRIKGPEIEKPINQILKCSLKMDNLASND